jgi:hypothetical protein
MFERIRQGWQLTKKSWGVVRSHPRLARLPLTGGVLALAAVVVLAIPGILLVGAGSDAATVVGYVLIAAGSYLASFFVIYYNVILAAAANDALEGREPDLDSARSMARLRIPQIAGWALVSAVVSLALTVLRDRGGLPGRIAASLGAAVWGLVTFLVVPVLALEGIGPIQAIKRSTNLTKRRWGQQVTGNFVIGGISGVATVVGVVLAAVGVYVLASGSAGGAIVGGLLIVLGLVVAVAAAVFGGATRGVFGVALYHFVADDRAVGPFTAPELASAARPR